MVAAATRLLPLATPPAASSSFRTSGKLLPAARARTEQGGEKPGEGLVGSVHPERKGGVMVFW